MIFLERIKSKFRETVERLKPILSRSESYRIVLPTFLVCLFLLIFVPFLFNNSGLRTQMEQKLSLVLDANLEINGKVSVALLPSPSISASDVILQDYNFRGEVYNFYAKKVTVKLSFLASLMGNFQVDKIIFTDAILQNYSGENKPTLNDSLTNILATKKAIEKSKNSGQVSGKIFVSLFRINDINLSNFNSTNLPKIISENGTWISYNKFGNSHQLNKINSTTTFSKKKIISQGSFANRDIINNFKLYARFEEKLKDFMEIGSSTLEITSQYGNFKVSGNFPEENLGIFKSKFKGVIEGEISDLKNFYKSYVAQDGFLFNKISPVNRSIKVKASVLNDNQQIVISNIFIASSVINGLGDIALDFSTKLPLIDIRMSLENIDLDAIFVNDKEITATDTKVQKNDEQKAADDTLNPAKDGTVSDDNAAIDGEKKALNEAAFDIAKDIRDFDLTAEIKVVRIKYLEDEIKNVNFYTTISKQGEILILPLSLEVPGGGVFRMSGVLENHEVPKFVGSLDASGSKLSAILKWFRIESQNLIYDNLKDYNLYADILLVPNLTTLNNIYLNINNGKSELLGEAKIRYTNKTSAIFSSFNIDNFVIDDYFYTSGQNYYLSTGSLLKKILWLNNLTSNTDLTLSFDKLIYKDLTFSDQFLKTRFGPGYLEISQFKLDSDRIKLSGSLNIDISGQIPKLSLSVKSDKFVYVSDVNNGAPSDLGQHNDKTTIINKITAIDQFYALPSLEGFAGDISLDLQQSSFDDLDLTNTKIAGKMKDGVFSFSDFSTDLYGGSLAFKGEIGMKFDKAISGNLTISKIALKPLLSNIAGINNIDGIGNISASIEVVASEKNEFIKNLNSSIKIGAVGLQVQRYGLNDLVKKMFNPQNYAADLREPEKILFNDNATTSLKQATGTINFTKERDNLFKIDFETIAANGIVSGKVDLVRKSLDASLNVVFLTGTLKKQIALNVATNLKGSFGNINQNSNFNQVRQYLGLPYDQSAVEIEAPKTQEKTESQDAANGNSGSNAQNNSLKDSDLNLENPQANAMAKTALKAAAEAKAAQEKGEALPISDKMLIDFANGESLPSAVPAPNQTNNQQ